MIDWAKITTDELLELIPDSEDNRWEYKAEGLMGDDNRFKLKIGKQVSAFANSGGGHIIMGLSDDRKWQAVPDQKGETSRKDWLARVVADSVDYPLQSFNIHRVPHTGDASKAAYVIEIRDSPATPHQNRADKIYYRRIDGHSDPAEHFYTELLRNRFTKAILQIKAFSAKVRKASMQSGMLVIDLGLKIQNVSRQATHHWGVFAQSLNERTRWTFNDPNDDLAAGVWLPPNSDKVILPNETRPFHFEMTAGLGHSVLNVQALVAIWGNTGIGFTPVSDNHTGDQFVVGNWTPNEWHQRRFSFEDEITRAMQLHN